MRTFCMSKVARLFLLFVTYIFIVAMPSHATKTVIDVISSDPAFSRLIKELQRLRLIVLINKREKCTFFAPTNAAFAKWDDENKGKRMDKQTLMYHLLPDSTLTTDLKGDMLLETLLVKEGFLGNHSEGQLIKVTKPSWRPGRKVRLLIGGAELLEHDWAADNGVVHVVDRLLTPPEIITETIQQYDELSLLFNIVHTARLDSLLQQHRPFTVFAPTTDALKKLNDIEVQYLRHPQGRNDLEITFHHHIHAGTLYKQDIKPGTSSVSTLEGQELMISLESDKLLIDNAEVVRTDILSSNGVIHMVSLPLLPSSLVWTPAKYLVGLNATKFVDSLRDAGLSRYIDDPEASYTIFAPQDDIFDPDTVLKDLLQYHVVPGKKLQPNFQDGQLLDTELYTEFLNGKAQKSKIQIKQENKRKTLLIDEVEIKGEPVQIGKSIIYLISKTLELPKSLVKTIKHDESLARYMDALSLTGLDKRLSDARGVTVFAPSTSAWESLGLVKNYLLLNDSSFSALESVVRYAIVEDIRYTAGFKQGSTLLRTSEGSQLVVEKKSGTIYVGEGRLERSEQVGGQVIADDILVKSGVIHKVSAVALPPTLAITLYNLLQGAGTNTFLGAFETSNITRILTSWEQDFTIFAPTDEAFKKAGLLEGALNDWDFAARLVRLHVIPGKVLKLEEDIDYDEASMLNSDSRLSFRDIHHDGKTFGVRVKGARSSKEARVVDAGYAHPAWSDEEYRKAGFSGYGIRQQFAVDGNKENIVDSKTAPRSGGVVYVIDRVLLPGDPDPMSAAWFWIGVVVLALLGTIVLCGLTILSVHALATEIRQMEGYAPVAAADEEAAAQNEGGAAVPVADA
ncbi:hypothetical protein BX616_005979 [Lobosporangium transversale]|uniref:FAS1 domain-containing protein n=1 Tax=Lobosporangium transversale TaxID=64571 RepID=A0A1Y2GDY1_9FUNG|nr:FAS1 domain-containing protein [Lobosporangium transversale]KAF9915529.1 hypothetical protein BX616_005979 [Lobosporangium transversale]ORZ05116.1 FAS1 domain-containing protein [Lobosporangium transversale]|eukprot:XP_021876891.1 FAS1 domain-containing protein [Lobosporangium transversale]